MNNLHHAPLEQHSSTAKYREAEKPNVYEHQDFPKLVYKGKGHKSVNNAAEEEAALAAGFSLKPPDPEPAKDGE